MLFALHMSMYQHLLTIELATIALATK